jgi:hypothetical protein
MPEQKHDDFPFVVGYDRVIAIGALCDETATDSVDEGDIGIPRMTADRQLRVAPGGSGASDLGKAEDAAHTSGDVGVMSLAVRQDTMAALAGTTGDYIPITTDESGQARVLVGCPDTVITVTPTCDVNAYASGDLIFDSTAIAAAVRKVGGTAILQSVTLIDKDDQGVALTLIFANAATDFGTLNAAPDPDDDEAATVIGHVPIAATDYVDLGGAKVACIRNLGLLVQAGAATTSLYVAAINGTGTPTYTAAGLVLQIGLLRS